MSALKRIQIARTSLIVEQPFFAALSLRLEVYETRFVSTMATDGVHMFYNPDFVNKLPMRELEAVICHEVMHCAAGHVWRRDGRDADKWNRACDFAINPIVIDAGYKLPKFALLDAKYAGMPAERIYPLLPDEEKQAQGGTGSPAPGGEVSPFGPGHNPDNDVLDAPADRAGEIETDWRMAVVSAIKQAKSMGKLPGNIERDMTEAVRPRVDWRSLLRRFVQDTARNDYTWSRPSTRYLCLGLYMPTIKSEQMPPIVVAIDTSGSIGGEELTAFASELQAIVQECCPMETYVLYVDAAVARADRFDGGELPVFSPRGGGGTDFRPAFDWVRKEQVEPACLVYLTDMCGTFPDEAPEYPVLWISTTGAEGPFGDTVRMDL